MDGKDDGQNPGTATGQNGGKWTMLKLAEGLYRIGSPLGPRHVYQYVLLDEEGALLVDAGMGATPEQAILPAVRSIGLDPARIRMLLLSHGDVDHFSGAETLRSHIPHLVVMAHRADVPGIESTDWITRSRYFAYETLGVHHDGETKQWFLDHLRPARVDWQLAGGETIRLGADRFLDILHIPGHSDGHLAVYDRKNRAAIIIDGILGRGLYDTEGRIISPPPYYDVEAYLDSIGKIRQLPFELLLTGHYDVMDNQEGHFFLEESRRFVDDLAGQLERMLADAGGKPLSLKELLHAANEAVGPFTNMMVELTGPVFSHLQLLERQGKAFRIYDGTIPHWFR